MENERQIKNLNPKGGHYAKFHEKVMIKFNEMQRKLDKSKSLDSLTFASDNDNTSYKEDRFSISSDVRYDDEVFFEAGTSRIKQSVTEEDVIQCYAEFQDLRRDQAKVNEEEFTLIGENDFEDFSEQIFSTARKATSSESLYEENEGNSHKTLLPIPLRARKMSIREKIGNRISVAKEKRRESKERKRDSVGKVEKLLILSNIVNDIPLKKRNKIATVTIALIEATGFESENPINDKFRLLYCRLRLGPEKRKSKIVKSNAVTVSWQELFNFNLYDDSLLEIMLMDKDISIGRATRKIILKLLDEPNQILFTSEMDTTSSIDLTEVEREKTHQMKLNLQEGNTKIQIFILLTISGTMANTFSESDYYQQSQEQLDDLTKRFAWYKIKKNLTDVGWLSVTVYGARGLAASETYCVLELGNERLQTHTYYKSQDPIWIKMFQFAITDVALILKVTIWDEKKYEEIGKVSIRLLKIHNRVKTWYALKDSSQRERAKGNNPRILLEMNFTWNLVKASIRAINPKEVKYLDTEKKFDRHIFARNWTRAKAVLSWVFDALKVLKTCFEWESRDWNLIALTIWLIFCWFFKAWMVPLIVLVPFAWYKPPDYFLINWKKQMKEENISEKSNEKEEKSLSLRQKIHSLQEMIQTVQETIGNFATFGESIKNLFNFTEPFLSFLAIFFIVVISLIMFIIPVRYIFMFWGCYKFVRKTLWPNRIPNNEIMDLLSRVPDDEILLDCEEMPLQELSEDDDGFKHL